MPKNNNTQLEQNLLDKGLKIIICAFNEQKKEYSKNILQLESEVKKLKEENNIYKNKLTLLQQKLNILSKTVCVLDVEAEEAKNQIDKKYSESKRVISTVSNNIINKNRKKNNSVGNKFTLYKNFLLQNTGINLLNHEQPESRNLNQKAFSNNLQYDLKYIIDTPKISYNKIEDNLNYLKRRKKYLQNENSCTHNSFLVENTPKNIDINIEESRTDRDFYKRKIFSEKNLEINKAKYSKNKINNKTKEILNIHNSISSAANDLNDINGSSMKKNEDNLFHINKKNKENNNNNNNNSYICSKNTSEDEIYFKDMKISGDNNSNLYKKLNNFLEECKIKLNALDYENVINLLKSFEIDSNIDIRKRVKKFLNNNHKLCKLFDNIFEV